MNSEIGLILWPDDEIPLPYVDVQGQPQHATLASGLHQMRIQRRNRFRSFTVSLSVRWVLSILQYDAFKLFYRTELTNGAAQFSIHLRYPYNSALTQWKVRFIGNHAATHDEGHWIVEATLELLSIIPPIEPTPEIPLNWEGFQVVNEEESGGWVQFVEADGHDFYVKKS